jgi:hypothetical protein
MHAQRTHHVARNALPRPRLTRLSFSTVYGSQCRFRARLLEQLLQLAVLLGVPLLRAHRRARLHPDVHCRNNAAAPLSSVRCGRA